MYRLRVLWSRNAARNAAKTGGPVERPLLESRYKPLVLLIELNANSGFSYKYTNGGCAFRAKKASLSGVRVACGGKLLNVRFAPKAVVQRGAMCHERQRL